MVLKVKENRVPSSIHRARTVSARVEKVLKTRRRRQVDKKARYAVVASSRKAAAARSRNIKVSLRGTISMDDSPVVEESAQNGESQIQQQSQSLSLPRTLPRPEYKELSRDLIAAADYNLDKDADIDYVREKLHELGPLMLRDITKVKATTPTQGPLPKELAILATDVVPNMMLAVWGPSSQASKSVTLWPAHSIMLAISCANLPGLPSSSSTKAFTSEPSSHLPAAEVKIPVVPLSLPAPTEFAPLFAFIYTGDTNVLFRTLVPGERVPENLYQECARSPANRSAFARHLAETYTIPKLLTHVRLIKGVYQNTVVLGVFLEDLWQTMDMAWEVILGALAFATGSELTSSATTLL